MHAGSYAAPDSHVAKVTGGRVGAGPAVCAAFIWAVPFVGGAARVASPAVGVGAVPLFGGVDDGTDGRAVGHAPSPA